MTKSPSNSRGEEIRHRSRGAGDQAKMDNANPYHVPQGPGRWPAILLAVLVHAVLFTFLWVGIHWHNDAPKTVDAEAWGPGGRNAAPRRAAVSQPTPASVLTKQAPEIKEHSGSSPNIALMREAEDGLQKEQNAHEQEAKAEQRRVDEARKEAEAKKELADAQQYKQDTADRRKIERQRQVVLKNPTASSDEQVKKEHFEQERKTGEDQAKAEQQRAKFSAMESEKRKRLAEDKKRKQDALDEENAAQQRQAELKRVAAAKLDAQKEEEYIREDKQARDYQAKAEQQRAKFSAMESEKRKSLAEDKKRKQDALDEENAAQQRQAELKRVAAAKLDAQEKEEHIREEKQARDDQAKADRQQAEDKKNAAEKHARLVEENKRKEDDMEAKKMAEQRQAELTRIASERDESGASGAAAKPQGNKADISWSQRVSAKVKSNIIYAVPAGLDTNPPAEFVVGLLPDGSVAGVRKARSSGIRGFDEAVRRAIEQSQPYPADSSGNVPSSFVSSDRPKDQ